MRLTVDVDVPSFKRCTIAEEIGLYSKTIGFKTTWSWYQVTPEQENATLLLSADREKHKIGRIYRAPNNMELRELLWTFQPYSNLIVEDVRGEKIASIVYQHRGETQYIRRTSVKTTIADACLQLLIDHYQNSDWRSSTAISRGLSEYIWSQNYVELSYRVGEHIIVEYFDNKKHQSVLTRLDQMLDQILHAPDLSTEDVRRWCEEHRVRFLPIQQTEYELSPVQLYHCDICERDVTAVSRLPHIGDVCSKCATAIHEELKLTESQCHHANTTVRRRRRAYETIQNIVNSVCDVIQDPSKQYMKVVTSLANIKDDLNIELDTQIKQLSDHKVRMRLAVGCGEQLLYMWDFDCNVEVKDNTNKKGASYADEAD